MEQENKELREKMLNENVITQDIFLKGTIEFKISDELGLSEHKPNKLSDEYIEAITAHETFIKKLMMNETFIKNIKAIVGGMK